MIHDMMKLLDVVEECTGKVILHLPNGTERNLKGNFVLQQALLMTPLGKKGLTLKLTSSKDEWRFAQYMKKMALY
jgi:hypothetical protein